MTAMLNRLSSYLLALVTILYTQEVFGLQLGTGRADITGPIAEIGFMGYAQLSQRGRGIHLRQFARTFIFDDGENRLVFVSADCAMIPHGVRKEVVLQLQRRYGSIYSLENVMISGTHTHSTPGGFMQDFLFDLSVLGFLQETFDGLVSGIVRSVIRAHESIIPGKLKITQGELLDANINRSPISYLNNPASERESYKYDVDKTMTQLQLLSLDDKPVGIINWFAVHATSMNYSNKLVSSDNMGYASILLEKFLEPGKLPGRTNIVAAFASSNLGDVSPNIMGPKCQKTGLECDLHTSRCTNLHELCISSGPGKDMFESTLIIAKRLVKKAEELWKGGAKDLTVSKLNVIHQFIRPSDQETIAINSRGEEIKVRGCTPAMGYSFAAGTTDGPGSFSFQQSTTSSNPMWNLVRDILAKPSDEDIACQAPKPILLATGRMNIPFEWQPDVASTQLAVLGNLVLACVPGEFSTMSGRRLRSRLSAKFGDQAEIIIVGLCNTYTDYITTPEEYMMQRYEGASTIFGPFTLPIYLDQFDQLADAILKGEVLSPGPEPANLKSNVFTLQTSVVYDFPAWEHNFGDCIESPKGVVYPGDLVRARFISGHPRNNLMHEKSFLVVERKDEGNPDLWETIAIDADWNTRLYWERTSVLLGTSEVLITWLIPDDVIPGEYRIRHMGYYKKVIDGIERYSGNSPSFQVQTDKYNTRGELASSSKSGPR